MGNGLESCSRTLRRCRRWLQPSLTACSPSSQTLSEPVGLSSREFHTTTIRLQLSETLMLPIPTSRQAKCADCSFASMLPSKLLLAGGQARGRRSIHTAWSVIVIPRYSMIPVLPQDQGLVSIQVLAESHIRSLLVWTSTTANARLNPPILLCVRLCFPPKPNANHQHLGVAPPP
ncbi:hypothetical protein BDV96DRAFT_230396 [Lophiotrema nucula]|uniref:Uncharacterized protein n=1 Tax=Lophiotrema nucula TaxID=690887 RepID=A0A6A5YSX0_9PLEO|nr:hypothetical protein BDV96DRAFT_230396 [Lophiotrema nucula]